MPTPLPRILGQGDTSTRPMQIYGHWRFITSFRITCYTKQNFTIKVVANINQIFYNHVFEQYISFFINKKIKSKNVIVIVTLSNFRFTSTPFQCLFCISCRVKIFHYFLGGSHLSRDSFFIFNENTLQHLKEVLKTTSSFHNYF